MGLSLFINSSAMAATATAPVPLAALQSFVAVYERIRLQHVDAKTDEELLQLALEGLILKLDPFSSYLDANDMARLQEETRGEYSGIGIELVPDGTYIRVITPIDNGPADRAGIRPGDWITHIQGNSVKGLDVHAIDLLMTGETGTELALTLLRDGEELKVNLIREIITTKSVRSEFMDEYVGYIRISRFQENTSKDLIEQMHHLTSLGADRWLLDLRNNPGGTLEAASQVADAFLTQGNIVTTKARQSHDNISYDAHSTDPSNGWPLVVLINAGSASASEIVAGAIKDHKRGQLVGNTSYGKGSVQSIIALPQGAGVKLTTAYYYTPAGHNIHQTGIAPHVQIDDSNSKDPSNADIQLATALNLLNKPNSENQQ